MKASAAQRAMAAAVSTAAAFDLTVNDAIVLHDSNKLTLRLLPCAVLARVAPVAEQVAQFEIELAQTLAESHSPVAALEPRVEPRVYERDGFAITLWTCYDPATPQEVAPADYADALVRLHAGMRKLDVRAPHFTDRVEEAQQLVAHHEERAAVHRSRDVLSWAGGIRRCPCARRSQRALSGCRSRPAARVPEPGAGDDHNVALGSRRPIPKRAPAGQGRAQPDPSITRMTRPRMSWHAESVEH
jgi:hypothetical protein